MSAFLLNPQTADYAHFDEETRRLLRATVDFFESYGKQRLLQADLDADWVTDFLAFEKREKLFATFLTPAAYADGDPNRRWDAARNAALSEILGFYGLSYWYAEQVTILGLGPIWMSANEDAKRKAARQLADGGVMAFGLSERAHGADVYDTDMILTPTGDGGFTASGTKYYIGNGNVAGMVSVFGRRADVEGPEGYVFFAADSAHPAYELIDNVVHSQMFVSTFALHDYPVTAADVLHTGPDAFAAALNTVNVGKFNLCHGAIGIGEHAFYEAITHANNRILYGHPVTDFSHVRANFVDAYARLAAMKLFSDRSVDYFRSASREDRRYLLFNPMTKSKVTSEGEKVVTLLLDVIAAKGYEKTTYFHQANRYIGWMPRLEGTVHVNVAQILKYMPNYLLNPAEYPEIGTRLDPADDAFFFAQGPLGGASKVPFADWTTAYEAAADEPNVAIFYEQAKALREFLLTAAPDKEQAGDLDFVLNVGHLFSLVVYGQLILEQAALTGLDRSLLSRIFDVQIRDFSAYAVGLYGKPGATPAQQQWALDAVRRPVADQATFDRVWEQVAAYDGAYEMRPGAAGGRRPSTVDAMPRTLLVTNDFPPRPGGIQTYLQAFVRQLPADELVVYASRWRGSEEYDAAQPFEVVRHPTTLLLPTPDAFSRTRDLVRSRDIETVWFGAAAPLALLGAPLKDAGALRTVASTHGHEVGWSMLPPSRACLRRIGDTTDVTTYVSKYTRGRFAAAFGPRAALEHLPPGVDTDVFRPDDAARSALRARYGLGEDEPVVLCLSRLVPRKGQDMLIRALPRIRAQVPGARLMIVGGGPYAETLHTLARRTGVDEQVIFTGSVPFDELAAHHNVGDVFAMPCRTRGAGLDVEGLGIVFLEASATGKPVVAGDSGGAPETVWEGESGHVVPGRDVEAIADAVAGLLADPDRAATMGARGRELVAEHFDWRRLGHRLQTLLNPYGAAHPRKFSVSNS